ncbi:uncharacterized protein [Penaeus vannamei]|uniref:uncharacterized protein n=1 Tax=Penaeus vannamei TaxID=6689 RepID=UPI00387F6333
MGYDAVPEPRSPKTIPPTTTNFLYSDESLFIRYHKQSTNSPLRRPTQETRLAKRQPSFVWLSLLGFPRSKPPFGILSPWKLYPGSSNPESSILYPESSNPESSILKALTLRLYPESSNPESSILEALTLRLYRESSNPESSILKALALRLYPESSNPESSILRALSSNPESSNPESSILKALTLRLYPESSNPESSILKALTLRALSWKLYPESSNPESSKLESSNLYPESSNPESSILKALTLRALTLRALSSNPESSNPESSIVKALTLRALSSLTCNITLKTLICKLYSESSNLNKKTTETEDLPAESYGQQENRCGSLGTGKAWLQVKVTATGRKALSGIFQTEMPCVAMATVTRVGGQPTRVQVSPSDEGNTGLKHCSLRGDAVFLELEGRRRGM